MKYNLMSTDVSQADQSVQWLGYSVDWIIRVWSLAGYDTFLFTTITSTSVLGPNELLSNQLQGPYLQEKSGQDTMLTPNLHLVP